MRRVGIRIANVALFTLCCFLVAEVFNDISAELLMVARAATPPPLAVESQRVRSWEERRPIIERNLFGAQIAAVPAAPPVDVSTEPLTATELPLRLLGTVLSDAPVLSRATIEDKGSRKHEVVRTGDFLQAHPQVQLLAIERGRVILLNQDQREELRLQEDSGARTPAPKRLARRGRTRRSRRSGGTETSSLGSLSERLKDLQSDDGLGRTAADLLTQGRLLPKYSDGEMIGMQVNDVQPGSFYERLGIEDGDVISSVNGIPIDSAAAGSKILQELSRAPEVVIEFDGDKQPTSFDMDQLPEELRRGAE